jgi:hypothetical protein
VGLGIRSEVISLHLRDASFIDIARRYMAGSDQVTQPLGGVGLDLVVVGGHPNPHIAAITAATTPTTATAPDHRLQRWRLAARRAA